MDIKESEWYIVVICLNCRTRHFVRKAPAPDSPQENLIYPLSWAVPIHCDCGTRTDFRGDQVIRWQAPLFR